MIENQLWNCPIEGKKKKKKSKNLGEVIFVKLTTWVIGHVWAHWIWRSTLCVHHSSHAVHGRSIRWAGAHHPRRHVGVTWHSGQRRKLEYQAFTKVYLWGVNIWRHFLSVIKYASLTNLLCREFVAGCCMAAGSWGFLFMPGGGHIPEPTWGGMLPMLGGMLGPIFEPYGRAPIWLGGILPGGMPVYGCPPPCPAIGFIGPMPGPE